MYIYTYIHTHTYMQDGENVPGRFDISYFINNNLFPTHIFLHIKNNYNNLYMIYICI